MWRLIFLGLIIWLTIYLVKHHLIQSDKTKPNTQNTTDAESRKSSDIVEDMVQCAHCAVHLPRSEAFLVDGKIYCSKNHIPIQ